MLPKGGVLSYFMCICKIKWEEKSAHERHKNFVKHRIPINKMKKHESKKFPDFYYMICDDCGKKWWGKKDKKKTS